MDNQTQKLLEQRKKRVADAVQLREPDRVPFVPFPHFFPANYYGISFKEFMYDYDKTKAAAKKFILDFEPDLYLNPIPTFGLGPTLELLDFKQLKWPGHGVADDATYQWIEDEYMQAEEYDAFFSDPTDFMLRTYLPRVAGAFEPLKNLPSLPSTYYLRVVRNVAVLGLPEVADAVKRLLEAGAEAQKMMAKALELATEINEAGFAPMFGGAVYTPFDFWGDNFRGTRGMMLDLFRNPDKIHRAIEKILPILIESTVPAAKASGCPYIFIPLHKGLDGFMSLDQFKTFYWPSLRELMLTLIEAGLVPCPLWEGNCTSRLETIADIPKGKAIYWFEQTDIFKAKEILGDTVCIRGNVPASLLITGSAQQVRDYCKKLIDIVGKDGGFIMDGATGVPDEAKPENVVAMAEITKEYGKYE
jgi:hypothetical protein